MAQQATASDGQPSYEEPASGLWSGMIGFASFMMLLVGGFHVIGGFVALFEEDQYRVGSTNLMISVDYDVWGIAHMALGAGLFMAGVALFFRKDWARVVAVILASVSAVTNLAFLSAAPVWYALMILIDILIIYAVTVHFHSDPDIDY